MSRNDQDLAGGRIGELNYLKPMGGLGRISGVLGVN
jgi:hypothetical protein